MKIPYARPDITTDDIQAVVDVLHNEWLTQGPLQERFETAIAQYAGVRYAVAVANGTAALHLVYLAMGVGPGRTILTSPNTFVATANAAYYCGGKAEFVDIDPRTYNLSPDALAHKLEAQQEDLPFLIVPVHFSGQSAAMEEISSLARDRGIAEVAVDEHHPLARSVVPDGVAVAERAEVVDPGQLAAGDIQPPDVRARGEQCLSKADRVAIRQLRGPVRRREVAHRDPRERLDLLLAIPLGRPEERVLP